ncbi:MAG: DUF1178 family protein [Sphingomonadales bacterium]|nr:MAG: DUF1178 family protein [Sphingomonadales bacterium]TNF06185.1 MAG: DUF1178 family protein [Sphingomonadales bacterium]
MIVFDLKCAGAGHVFEGWFASGDDFERQKSGGMLACPICGDTAIEKAVMSPAVGAKSNQRNENRFSLISSDDNGAEAAEEGKGVARPIPMHSGMDNQKVIQLMHALAQAQADALADSEWVGRRFADQARAMHYGEEDHRAIHGEVAPQEARDLIEEGVDVAPLLFPVVPPKAQN